MTTDHNEKMKTSTAILFPHSYVPGFARDRILSSFGSITVCQPWYMDSAAGTEENDSRITKVGNFIRKTRIDELPQLLNVFLGDMSLIGPRPEREVFIEELEKSIVYYRFRHAVKPGITGLAQVRYPYGASVEDAVWKHKYDIFYIKHHSFWLDIRILFATLKVVIFGMGR
ncbi:MAG: hypothetical protein CEE42_05175 [Promethearchaeota archaeon Loki_b31]|nr:MAG: hypothetical protein CEE42_05175 [Candidatus Lokiarchaeota archaeon Loki_b31]